MTHTTTGWIILVRIGKDFRGKWTFVPSCNRHNQPNIYSTRKIAREYVFPGDRIVKATQITTWEESK